MRFVGFAGLDGLTVLVETPRLLAVVLLLVVVVDLRVVDGVVVDLRVVLLVVFVASVSAKVLDVVVFVGRFDVFEGLGGLLVVVVVVDAASSSISETKMVGKVSLAGDLAS